MSTADIDKCPVMGNPKARHTAAGALSNSDWWPNQLNLKMLHQNQPCTSPMGDDFCYAEEFNKIDLEELKAEIITVMTTSQDWWPADYGHYGPLFIRMAWHSAGTYRVGDGRGGASSGTLRFAPLNSWPDNANLDKARRLLWPVKKKYGRSLSWADLMVYTGNVALEHMGFETLGFAGGREDVWEPEGDIYWGPESEWLGDKRYTGDRELETPLGAVQMGLIYVNPEGPNAEPDPQAAAHDIRETFGRMAMNDEETVALIAGGHTFGKAHGAANDGEYVGPEPEGAGIEAQGFGWENSFGSGKGNDSITSGLEGPWTSKPTEWDNEYFDNLFNYEWELTHSPGGAQQWTPKGGGDVAVLEAPASHNGGEAQKVMMFTTDLALRIDPDYEKISRRFHENPADFAKAFAEAWYKLTHRDMGPVSRCLGSKVPEARVWQDPVPACDHELIGDSEVADLKAKLLDCGLSISELVRTAWSAASTFRCTDLRGGANGGRLRLAPQKDWVANHPEELSRCIAALEKVQADFTATGKTVSFADVVVLGGCAAVEAAAKAAGKDITVPFSPGRTDATDEMTDVESFGHLEPSADGFRNYCSPEHTRPAEELLVDKAHLLSLTAPEMTVLVGGLRAMNANHGESNLGVFTDRPGQLTNDFFVNLLDMGVEWKKHAQCPHIFEGRETGSSDVKWQASGADLVFGSNSQLRAIAEAYACDDACDQFVNDFVAAWDKVMNLDRFDLA
ncbi:MAG: catalase/peroxidase HPI [Planctomycetota bacterium]